MYRNYYSCGTNFLGNYRKYEKFFPVTLEFSGELWDSLGIFFLPSFLLFGGGVFFSRHFFQILNVVCWKWGREL